MKFASILNTRIRAFRDSIYRQKKKRFECLGRISFRRGRQTPPSAPSPGCGSGPHCARETPGRVPTSAWSRCPRAARSYRVHRFSSRTRMLRFPYYSLGIGFFHGLQSRSVSHSRRYFTYRQHMKYYFILLYTTGL